jgi:hypothetical protein
MVVHLTLALVCNFGQFSRELQIQWRNCGHHSLPTVEILNVFLLKLLQVLAWVGRQVRVQSLVLAQRTACVGHESSGQSLVCKVLHCFVITQMLLDANSIKILLHMRET